MPAEPNEGTVPVPSSFLRFLLVRFLFVLSWVEARVPHERGRRVVVDFTERLSFDAVGTELRVAHEGVLAAV